MKRLSAIILAVSILVSLFGCSGKGDEGSSSYSSVYTASETESTENPAGLFSSSAEEPVVTSSEEPVVTSSEEPVVTSSEETSNSDSSLQDTQSRPEEESQVASANQAEKDDGIIEPSKINNPTGIVSTGRKNNSGDDWKMTLVNPWNTLHISYSVDLAAVDSRFATDKYFDSRAVKYLNQMCEAAANDGVSLYVISAFRTFDYQQGLFNSEVSEYYSYHPNATKEEAETGASTEVARPGTSEHNLGLAVDFNSVEQSFENTDAYRWLQKHCTEYGFIMRYAADKQDCTGVIYEPWHYRYVGKGNAKKIAASGLCLEEYLKQYNSK